MKTIELGEKYKDIATGFVGTAVAHVEYLHAKPRTELEGQSDGTTLAPSGWFEDSRLVPYS